MTLTMIIHQFNSEHRDRKSSDLELNASISAGNVRLETAGENLDQIVSFEDEICQNKQRIQKLEHLFQALTEFIKHNGMTFFEGDISDKKQLQPPDENFSQDSKLRIKLVEILTLSVSIWEMYTGKSIPAVSQRKHRFSPMSRKTAYSKEI